MVHVSIDNQTLVVQTNIPYSVIMENEDIQRFYHEIILVVIEMVDEHGDLFTEIRMKPDATSTKKMRLRTISQWILLYLTELEHSGGYSC